MELTSIKQNTKTTDKRSSLFLVEISPSRPGITLLLIILQFIALCLVTLAVAAPQTQNVQLLKYFNDNDGLGKYQFGFEQSDGTQHQVQGEVKNQGRDDEALVVRGRYSWVDPNGVTYIVTYTADENGYRPVIEQGPGGAVPGPVVASLG
ncbi:endocuticle structural protein SgAbd-6-like [Pectinophora gossypiella]|uniref:endocuticle structural protein SgAbd-6-like n=1 Tax=Pectinophora gossypiella TaxID=13191 RepID=UPI00214E2E38|nr:endocuticle structural protein SgAbd-6-like [Pectinophora gossypiella]